MMKEFIEYILQFGTLNQNQIALISKKAIEIELKKDEYFIEAGKISKDCHSNCKQKGCHYYRYFAFLSRNLGNKFKCSFRIYT